MRLFVPSTRAEAVARRTYQRPLDDEGSKFESWNDVIERSHRQHHIKLWEDAGGKVDHSELEELVQLGLTRSGTVAGRTLWLGGTEYAYSRSCSQFNCAAIEIDTVYDMVDAFWLLLNGCGVGGLCSSGTLHGYNHNIPILQIIPSEKDKNHRGRKENIEILPCESGDYIWTIKVGDSAESWAKALGKMLISPRGRVDKLIIDFSECRGKGGRLKGYGWLCNGSKPLATMMAAIHHILNKNAGTFLGEEDIADVFNFCGTVLSSRRAAEALVLPAYHPLSQDFIHRKFEYWKNGNDHRRQSNNSLLFWQKPSIDELVDLLRMNYTGGEPGFINGMNALKRCPWFKLFNPCFEILLASHGFCVSGETILMTEDSASPIRELVGKKVKVWNGNKWSEVTPQITGYNKKLLRVKLSDGSHLDCTEEHRFSVEDNDFQYTYKEVKARDLKPGDKLERFMIKEPKHSEEIPSDVAYTIGVICGDGSAEGITNGGRKFVDLTLYGGKKHLPVLGVKSKEFEIKGYKDTAVTVSGFSELIKKKSGIDITQFLHQFRSDGATILRVLKWSKDSMLAFLAGMADTDGSETGTGGIRIYAASKKTCDILQLIVRKCGMKSSVCFMTDKDSNFGPRKYPMWYIQITDCKIIPCKRLDTSKGHAPVRKGKWQKVVSIEELPGLHTVYCFNEPEKHKAVFGNVLTHQCNLISLCLPHFKGNIARLRRAIWIMARANYRQTCVNLNDPILQSRWHQTNEALRLCGVSLTGIVQASWLTDYGIQMLRNEAISGAYSMADELGMPRPKAVTTIKPEGTRSKIAGSTSMEIAEGMHLPLGRYIFNWINFSTDDPIVEHLQSSGYDTMINPSDINNILVRFPIEYSGCPFQVINGKEVNVESAVSQLKRYQRWNHLWADHNVSATISFSAEEIPETAQWIDQNWESDYIATAFIARTDPTKTPEDLGHPYLPQEVVTEEEYHKAMSKLKPINWDQAHRGWYDIEEAGGCKDGACAVK